MVLVDTSIWISHLRDNHAGLAELLCQGQVVCHPFVICEIACGNLKNRVEILTSLKYLPTCEQATHSEVLEFMERHHLMGQGLGLVDMHLLASAILSSVPFWTKDKRLSQAATDLGIAF